MLFLIIPKFDQRRNSGRHCNLLVFSQIAQEVTRFDVAVNHVELMHSAQGQEQIAHVLAHFADRHLPHKYLEIITSTP